MNDPENPIELAFQVLMTCISLFNLLWNTCSLHPSLLACFLASSFYAFLFAFFISSFFPCFLLCIHAFFLSCLRPSMLPSVFCCLFQFLLLPSVFVASFSFFVASFKFYLHSSVISYYLQ